MTYSPATFNHSSHSTRNPILPEIYHIKKYSTSNLQSRDRVHSIALLERESQQYREDQKLL